MIAKEREISMGLEILFVSMVAIQILGIAVGKIGLLRLQSFPPKK